MTKTLMKLCAGTVLAIGAIASQAQPAAGNPPASVGVSPGTAADAAGKAVPRSDTGTLVRTAPTAADRGRAAADGAANAPSTAATAPNTGAMPATGAAGDPPTPMPRARKADRS
ncbi:hypothetical protein [Xylophilus sp. GOD-11R]|uniref:hypothetical protein n=1 Tax=Xylophilus sp. GOD-11R TaxID=3089814 RepID=UPI00298D526C|nr:hypothetical protein [Xylophilus sp. GOD-11R]WPB58354.1 hypothetical protein R9X41_06840 [Xylophilus sp. GOD-11R]